MNLQRYRVRSITWKQEERAAVPVAGLDAEDAVLEWCGHHDGLGNFTEGYPKGDEIEVMHPCGLRTQHVVHTDFTPSFHVYDKAPPVTHESMTISGQCPRCGDQAYQESVDIGVGVIFGPWGCTSCAWSENESYDGKFGGGVQADGSYLDPMGGIYPAASPVAQFIRAA